MFTIKKIWNALNHAGKPWQISLAIAFGMIVGFTPLVSLHNIIILVFLLVLNIHIGVFALSISLFGILGLVLDPLFATFGTTILNSTSFYELFTSLYNTSFGQISQFNNTILMGSFVVSIALFPIVYILFSFLIVKYRSLIAIKIQNIPLLNKLQFFTNEEMKQTKTFRFVGLFVIVFLLGLVSLFKIFMFDDMVKLNIEKAISKSTNKIVQIEILSTSIFNSSLALQNVSVTDKEDTTSNINIKDIAIDISVSDLIFKRVVVENLIFNEISFPNSVNIPKLENQNLAPSKSSSQKESSSNSLTDLTSLKNLDISEIKEKLNKDYKAEFDKYKGYYEQIKPLFNSEKKIDEKRADGEFVYFNLNSSIPKVLIKKGIFSLLKDGEIIKGTFKNFTTNQALYQKPFELSVGVQTKKLKSLMIQASFLETNKDSLDSVNIVVKTLEIDPMIQKNISIQNTTIDTTFDLKITDKKYLEGYESISVLSTDIAFKEANKYITMLNKSLVNTKHIKGTIVISGEMNNPSVKIDSNLDTILKDKVTDILKSQKDTIKNEIKDKVKSKIKDKLEDKLGDKLKGILGF